MGLRPRRVGKGGTFAGTLCQRPALAIRVPTKALGSSSGGRGGGDGGAAVVPRSNLSLHGAFEFSQAVLERRPQRRVLQLVARKEKRCEGGGGAFTESGIENWRARLPIATSKRNARRGREKKV